MNLEYVPTHLYNVTRGTAGWPKSVEDDKEFKDWLIGKCKKILTESGPMSTARIYDTISNYGQQKTLEDSEQFVKLGCLYDHIYACVDRALRVIASQVWKLN